MRAQAAIEYLTTYAWAIMLLIIVIGALAYFGFTNVQDYIPSSCQVDGPFTCDEWVAYQDSTLSRPEVAVVITNPTNSAYTISEAVFNYEGETGDLNCGRIRNLNTDVLIPQGQTYLIDAGASAEFTCNPLGGALMGLPPNEEVKIVFNFTYRKGTDGFEREGSGYFITTVLE